MPVSPIFSKVAVISIVAITNSLMNRSRYLIRVSL